MDDNFCWDPGASATLRKHFCLFDPEEARRCELGQHYYVCVLLRVILLLLGGSLDPSILNRSLSMILSADSLATILIYFLPKFRAQDTVGGTGFEMNFVSVGLLQIWQKDMGMETTRQNFKACGGEAPLSCQTDPSTIEGQVGCRSRDRYLLLVRLPSVRLRMIWTLAVKMVTFGYHLLTRIRPIEKRPQSSSAIRIHPCK